MKIKHIYKEGEIYSPDDIDQLPKECNKFLEKLEEYDESIGHVIGCSDIIYKGHRYEYGSVMCIKSFNVEIIIKEL